MTVFITGGTSGIGRALAEWYLDRGYHVGVCGRSNVSFSHAHLNVYYLDVYNKDELSCAIEDFCTARELDVMIVSAGMYCDDISMTPREQDLTATLKTNIVGVVNALDIAEGLMTKQRSGKVAVIASVSGLLLYPKSTLYSKSKSAIISICNAYRQMFSAFNVSLTCVMPGYVDTEKLRLLNDGDLSQKPYLVGVDYAVSIIIRAMEAGLEKVVFPPKMRNLIKFLSMMPIPILTYIVMKNKKRNVKKNDKY